MLISEGIELIYDKILGFRVFKGEKLNYCKYKYLHTYIYVNVNLYRRGKRS